MTEQGPAVASIPGAVDEASVQAMFDWIARSLPGVLFRRRCEPDGAMVIVTAGIADLTGFPADDFVDDRARSYSSLVHPDDREATVAAVQAATAAGRPYRMHYRIITRSGDTLWVQEKGHPVRDQQGVVRWLDGFICERTDVEELRQAEARRRDDLQRQQSALVSLATASTVAEGDIDRVSRMATELVASAVEVERVSVWLLSGDAARLELVDLYCRSPETHGSEVALAAEDYPSYFTTMRSGRLIDADDACTDPRTSEFADGYLRPLGITSMLDAALRVGGEVVGVLCLEHVGEPRRWLDHEVHFAGEVADQISHALLNRARLREESEKERIQEQLFRSQKMEAIGRLAGGVAHDFNNLLTVITGHAEILLLGESAGEGREDVIQIAAAAERASELTQQLLAFARQESLVLTEVDLGATVEHLETMLDRLLGDDVQLRVSTPAERIVVRSTEGLIQQVLTNLVVNARDAMLGGGHISVTLERRELDPEERDSLFELPEGEHAVMHVHDTGRGMPAEVLENIFEPFFTTKESGKGTGLGLSTVYGIARRCGGAITATSTVGAGTTMTVYLPVVEPGETATASPPEAEGDASFGGGRTIVVAEDNRAVLALVVRVLERAGFHVLAAENTQDAIALLRRLLRAPSGADALPCLVITDVVMPGGGGFEVLTWVRSSMPSVPVTLISGYMDRRIESRAADVPRLTKPFSASKLRSHVRALLEAPRAEEGGPGL